MHRTGQTKLRLFNFFTHWDLSIQQTKWQITAVAVACIILITILALIIQRLTNLRCCCRSKSTNIEGTTKCVIRTSENFYLRLEDNENGILEMGR